MKKESVQKSVNTKEKLKIWRYIGLAVAVFLIAVLINGVGIYQFNWNNKVSTTLADYFPYPVLIVNNEIIKVKEFTDNYNVIINFQNSQIVDNESYQLDDNQIRADVLNKLIMNKVVMQLSKKYGVAVDSREVDSEINKIKSRLEEGDSLENKLKVMYDISVNDFIEKSLTPEILNVKLHQRYLEDENIDKSSKQINKNKELIAKKILERLNQGEDFADIAKNESEDDMTKEYGGDLGYFEKGEMVPEFEQVAFSLDVNDISDVVKTNYGYHIIKVTDKKVDDTGIEKVKASHILIKTEDKYVQWLKSNIEGAKVYVFMRGYKWSNGQVIIK